MYLTTYRVTEGATRSDATGQAQPDAVPIILLTNRGGEFGMPARGGGLAAKGETFRCVPCQKGAHFIVGNVPPYRVYGVIDSEQLDRRCEIVGRCRISPTERLVGRSLFMGFPGGPLSARMASTAFLHFQLQPEEGRRGLPDFCPEKGFGCRDGDACKARHQGTNDVWRHVFSFLGASCLAPSERETLGRPPRVFLFYHFVHPWSSFGEIRHRGQLADPGAARRGPEFYVAPKVDGNGKELPACQQQARHGESAYLDQFPYARTIVRPKAGGRAYFTGATNIAYDGDGNFRGSYTLKNSVQDSPLLCLNAPVSELRLYLNKEDFDADRPVEEKEEDGADLLRSLIDRFGPPAKRPKAE